MSVKYLKQKGKIGTVETKNRLIMTAMGVGVGEPDGKATDQFIRFYTDRARGGAGLIITEIVRVNEIHGIGEKDQLSLANDTTIPSFQKLANSVHQYDTKIFAQLQHPGRETYLALHPKIQELVSSSAQPSATNPQPTRALETEEVESLVKDFAAAAVRAKKAGMDGVEIHAAHGYLVHQFLSANVNKRTDKYGGSADNRRRFLLEIIEAIREVCGEEYPISVRISSSEFLEQMGIEDGITIDESIETAKACEAAGASLLNVSAGTYLTGNTIVEPTSYEQGWKIPLAAEIKKNVSIPVAAVGVIRDPEFAEQLLKDETLDFVAMGRSWLADPEWGEKALSGNTEDIRKCIGCLYCFETAGKALVTGESHACCSINPYMGQEMEYEEPKKNGAGRKVIVVGGGPAGLEAAMVLAQREFKVTLFEKENVLGGQMYLAAQPPHKQKIGYFITYCEKQLKKLKVDVQCGKEITADEIHAMKPYAVFVASGSKPFIPHGIKGVDQKNVYTNPQILGHKVKLTNKKIVVIGGGLAGLETAEFLQKEGNEVAIIEMAEQLGGGAFPLLVMDDIAAIKKMGIQAYLGYKLLEIGEKAVLAENGEGRQERFPCDAIVLSIGVRSDKNIIDELSDLPKVIIVGDAANGGKRIADAVHSAFEAAYYVQ